METGYFDLEASPESTLGKLKQQKLRMARTLTKAEISTSTVATDAAGYGQEVEDTL